MSTQNMSTIAAIGKGLEMRLEDLARGYVNAMIDQGEMTADMKDRASVASKLFHDFMLRDIYKYSLDGSLSPKVRA
jgi:hypothetical protein